MLAIALVVTNGYDTDGELEDVELHDAGAGVLEEGGGGGVHGECCHFADGVPAGGGDSYFVSE